jgi:hypothetical protein
MPMRSRLEKPTAVLLIATAVLAGTSHAAETAPPPATAESPPAVSRAIPLFLFASGEPDRRRFAERYLRNFCARLLRDTVTLKRYSRIVLLRPRDRTLDQIMADRAGAQAKEGGKRASPDDDQVRLNFARQVLAEAEWMSCGESAVTRERRSGEDTDSFTLVTLASLGSLPGKQQDSLLAERLVVDPGLPGSQIATYTAPTLDSSDDEQIVRWLGLDVLGLPAESALEGEIKLNVSPVIECDQLRAPDSCTAVGRKVDVTIDVVDTLWVAARTVNVHPIARCDTADRDAIQKQIETSMRLLGASDKKGDGEQKIEVAETPRGKRVSLKLLFLARGSCRFDAELRSPAPSADAAEDQGSRRTIRGAGHLEIRALPMLVTLYRPGALNEVELRPVEGFEFDLHQHKLAPWLPVAVTALPKPAELFDALRVMESTEVLDLGEEVRKEVAIITLNSAPKEALPLVTAAANVALQSLYEYLGYSVLERGPLCHVTAELMDKFLTQRTGLPAGYLDEWRGKCYEALSRLRKERVRVLTGRPAPTLRIVPVDAEVQMARRAIQNLIDRPAIEAKPADIRFATRIRKGDYRPIENYLVMGRAESGALSEPVSLRVRSDPGPADIELSLVLRPEPADQKLAGLIGA